MEARTSPTGRRPDSDQEDSMDCRSVIFDVGNVLLKWDPAGMLEQAVADPQARSRYLRGIFAHPRWLALDAGEIDFERALEEYAGELDSPPQEVLRLLDQANRSLQPLPSGIALLEELHRCGTDLLCLTNMGLRTFDYLRARHGFWERFRHIVVSARVRLIKPDPAIFRLLLEQAGVEAATTLFIDDHLPNVESARTLGIVAEHYDGSAACLERIRACLA
ncbi:hypothetical protein APB27_29875 [Pseudomonas aeruginosa]|nr:hypothetical protein APB27_29875 [Pseudomonas aeruginosa]RTT29170.1 HAD family phosphatase [Pseudomonas paraeruginosa]